MKKVEKRSKPFLVKAIPRLNEDLKALRNMTEKEEPPRRQIRENVRQWLNFWLILMDWVLVQRCGAKRLV